MFFFGNNEWNRVFDIEHLRTLWAARPTQHWSGVVWSREQQQVRAEIGRHLRERYEVGSRTIPTRFAQLAETMEQSQFRSEQLRHAGHSMSKRDEYLANAKECERLAESTPNAEERAAWLQMAQQWRRWANGKSFGASRADEEPDRG
jgi:hypothetical protein